MNPDLRDRVDGLDERDRAIPFNDADFYGALGRTMAGGLAAALALHELRAPRCRPCRGGGCYSMSEADAPYCGRCRREADRRAMAQAVAE
jgi:hypothetical protein